MATVDDVIGRLPVLREVDADTARRIAEQFSLREFAAGEVICREGTPRENLVLVHDAARPLASAALVAAVRHFHIPEVAFCLAGHIVVAHLNQRHPGAFVKADK